jgi:hypothetical protein
MQNGRAMKGPRRDLRSIRRHEAAECHDEIADPHPEVEITAFATKLRYGRRDCVHPDPLLVVVINRRLLLDLNRSVHAERRGPQGVSSCAPQALNLLVMRLPGGYFSIKNIQDIALNQPDVTWVDSPTGRNFRALQNRGVVVG